MIKLFTIITTLLLISISGLANEPQVKPKPIEYDVTLCGVLELVEDSIILKFKGSENETLLSSIDVIPADHRTDKILRGIIRFSRNNRVCIEGELSSDFKFIAHRPLVATRTGGISVGN